MVKNALLLCCHGNRVAGRYKMSSAATFMSSWEVLAKEVGPEYILSKTYKAIHSVLFDAVW